MKKITWYVFNTILSYPSRFIFDKSLKYFGHFKLKAMTLDRQGDFATLMGSWCRVWLTKLEED